MTISQQTEFDHCVWNVHGQERASGWAGRGRTANGVSFDVVTVSWNGVLWWSLLAPNTSLEDSVGIVRKRYTFGARPGQIVCFLASIDLSTRACDSIVPAEDRLEFLQRNLDAMRNPLLWLIQEGFHKSSLIDHAALGSFYEDAFTFTGMAPEYRIYSLEAQANGGWAMRIGREKDNAQALVVTDADLKVVHTGAAD